MRTAIRLNSNSKIHMVEFCCSLLYRPEDGSSGTISPELTAAIVICVVLGVACLVLIAACYATRKR